MTSLALNSLETVFSSALIKLGFFKAQRDESGAFDNGFSIYKKDGVRLRLISNRGQGSVDISSANDGAEWFDFNLLRNHCVGADILNVGTDDELAEFLLNNFPNLRIMFSSEISDTVLLMKNLEKERFNRMFPNATVNL